MCRPASTITYEPRVKGRYYLKPVRYSANFELSTDARKPLSFDAGYGFSTQPAIGTVENAIEIGANLRLGQQFVFNYEIEGHKSKNERGYVMNNSAGDTITFARRDVTSAVNTLSASYIFNYKTSLTLRMRHYWSGSGQ